MREPAIALSALLAILGAACSNSSSMTAAPVYIVVNGPVVAATNNPATLVNHSGAEVHVGVIGCYARFDRQTANGWSAVAPREDILCPQPDYTVLDGQAFPFSFNSPADTGTYRLWTFVAGDTVRSAAFVVR